MTAEEILAVLPHEAISLSRTTDWDKFFEYNKDLDFSQTYWGWAGKHSATWNEDLEMFKSALHCNDERALMIGERYYLWALKQKLMT